MSAWAAWAIAIPVITAVVILALPRLADRAGYFASVATALATVMLLPAVRAGETVELTMLSLTPQLGLVLRVDALGMTFGLLASGLWAITAVYSTGYARAVDLGHRARYHAAFAASVGAAMGVAFAGNLLTFFLFYEALTLTTYPLVIHKENAQAFAAGRRYLLFSLGGGLAFLTATAWTWHLTGYGPLDFQAGGLLGAQPASVLMPLFVLFVLGVAVKSAVMPLHAWLPAAMIAPTPVSALLHAVAVVKAGVFGTLRVIGYIFGPDSLATFVGDEILAAFALMTIVIGSLIAVRQDNLKRRLAYSTIVHLSYIVLGAALVAPFGYLGSTVHMVNHGLAKITLFFCAGAIYATTHKEKVSELSGLGRQMPWTFAAFTVASLGLIGFPGLSGFVGKLLLGRGAIETGDMLSLAVMLGGSIFTAMYLLPIVRVAYFPRLGAVAAPGRAAGLPSPADGAGGPTYGLWSTQQAPTSTAEFARAELGAVAREGARAQGAAEPGAAAEGPSRRHDHPPTGMMGQEERTAEHARTVEDAIVRADARPAMLVPLLVTAFLVIVFGALPAAMGIQFELAAEATRQVFGGGALP
jgi:multicomponent Na+:H+ antiporter subunit D